MPCATAAKLLSPLLRHRLDPEAEDRRACVCTGRRYRRADLAAMCASLPLPPGVLSQIGLLNGPACLCTDCGAASVKAYQLSKDTPSFKVRADLPPLLRRRRPDTALCASSWAGRRRSSCPRRGAERRGARSRLDHSGCSRHQRTRGWPSTHSRRPSWRTSSRYPPSPPPSPAIDLSPCPLLRTLSSILRKAERGCGWCRR